MNNPFIKYEDSRLMELYQEGNEQAFELIYSRSKNKVYSYLKKRLNRSNEDFVDDIFQNVFVKLHKSRHLYKSERPFNNWLYSICRTVLIDSLRKSKVVIPEAKELLNYYKNQDYQSYFDIDNEKSLTEKEKEAIKLRYLFDEDFEKISNTLGTTVLNSRKLVSRGLKKLKEKISKKRGLYQ